MKNIRDLLYGVLCIGLLLIGFVNAKEVTLTYCPNEYLKYSNKDWIVLKDKILRCLEVSSLDEYSWPLYEEAKYSMARMKSIKWNSSQKHEIVLFLRVHLLNFLRLDRIAYTHSPVNAQGLSANTTFTLSARALDAVFSFKESVGCDSLHLVFEHLEISQDNKMDASMGSTLIHLIHFYWRAKGVDSLVASIRKKPLILSKGDDEYLEKIDNLLRLNAMKSQREAWEYLWKKTTPKDFLESLSNESFWAWHLHILAMNKVFMALDPNVTYQIFCDADTPAKKYTFLFITCGIFNSIWNERVTPQEVAAARKCVASAMHFQKHAPVIEQKRKEFSVRLAFLQRNIQNITKDVVVKTKAGSNVRAVKERPNSNSYLIASLSLIIAIFILWWFLKTRKTLGVNIF